METHECKNTNPNRGDVYLTKEEASPNWLLHIDCLTEELDSTIMLDVVFCPFCGEQLQPELILYT